MFGRKCTLCGGNLDIRNICKECGLDNNKSEKNYRVNQSGCDGEPLTHIHEEEGSRQKRAYQMAGPERKSGRASAVAKVIVILSVIMTIGGIVLNVIEDYGTEINQWVNGEIEDAGSEDYKYDPYQYVENELSETGDFAEYELSSGQYIVGFHIPEGKYSALTLSGFDSIKVNDDENGIYLYEYGESQDSNLDDLRLFEGAVVTIKCEETVKITSDNAQTVQMEEGMENPVTEAVEIAGNKMMTAGKDFEAGIYDVMLIEGEGYVDFRISDENGEEMENESMYFGEKNSDGTSFTYMRLPEKSTVTCSQEMKIKITPSEKICNAFLTETD